VAAADRLSAAGLRVLGAGPRGDDARPSWRWLIALTTSRERRDEIVSACRRAGIEALMPVAAFAQPAQLNRHALPNTRAFCDLALKVAVVPGLDEQLAAVL
jgi:dTDP-4-amino-4,6-dideoxygalactose transaminase